MCYIGSRGVHDEMISIFSTLFKPKVLSYPSLKVLNSCILVFHVMLHACIPIRLYLNDNWYMSLKISCKWCFKLHFAFMLGRWYSFNSTQASFYLIRGRMFPKGRYCNTPYVKILEFELVVQVWFLVQWCTSTI